MTLDDMKPGIRQLLVALDFLHSECHIIHTDVQLKNLLLPGPEKSYLSRFEEFEVTDLSPRKMLPDRTIYKTLGFLPRGGLPVLADFGEARLGDEDKEHDDDIMPNVYRAPEVMLRSKWDYKVDIWSVAMVAWDIVSSRTLINGKNADGIFDDRVHMAELVALLGPPPPEFRQQRHLSSVYWDESGKWKGVAPIPISTLESLAEKVEGEDKEGHLRWLRMALQWNPEDRPTALELLYDEVADEGAVNNSASEPLWDTDSSKFNPYATGFEVISVYAEDRRESLHPISQTFLVWEIDAPSRGGVVDMPL